METPPATPPGKRRPLGAIIIVIATPILAVSVGVAASTLGGADTDMGKAGETATLASLGWMVAATILSSVLIAQRSGTKTGWLAFFGLLLFYTGVAFAAFSVIRNPAAFR